MNDIWVKFANSTIRPVAQYSGPIGPFFYESFMLRGTYSENLSSDKSNACKLLCEKNM